MTSKGVIIDSSFIDLVLHYFSEPSESILDNIAKHKAAERTYVHAQIFSDYLGDIKNFWRKILERERS